MTAASPPAVSSAALSAPLPVLPAVGQEFSGLDCCGGGVDMTMTAPAVIEARYEGAPLCQVTVEPVSPAVCRLIPAPVATAVEAYPLCLVLLAAIEAVSAATPALETVLLPIAAPQLPSLPEAISYIREQGCTRQDGEEVAVRIEQFWQVSSFWTGPHLHHPHPDYWVTSALPAGNVRHPQRRAKVPGEQYRRYIPWLHQSLSFSLADPATDLDTLHCWEVPSRDGAAAFLPDRLAAPHILPLIGRIGDRPFGYFEVYWAPESQLAPSCSGDTYDRGWRVTAGDDTFRDRDMVSAWLPSLMHFLFLDDLRTRRCIVTPAPDQAWLLDRLPQNGFALPDATDLPDGPVMPAQLFRDGFFRNRLWLPPLWPALATAGDSGAAV